MSEQKTILIIDDDEDFATAITTLLERNGYAVHSARDGREGLEQAKKLRPDLILLDVMMTERTEGFFTLQHMRSIADRMAINRAMRRRPLALTISWIGHSRHDAANGQAALERVCVEHETPLGTVLSREREHQVHQGLGRLRAMDRETLIAFYFDGRTLLEMSEAFDSPVGTIKRRLHVARKRLARELEALAPA